MGFQEKNAEVERPAVLEIWFFEEGRPEIERSDVTVTSHAKHSNICPPDINQDQEDINNSIIPNSDTDSDHKHDDSHDDSSSDNTASDDAHSGALDNKTPKNYESARAHLQ